MKKKNIIIYIMIILIGLVVGILGPRIYYHLKFEFMYDSILKEETNDVLFIGRPTCSFCNLLKPILDETSKKYHINYRYINTDTLTKNELNKLLNKLSIRRETFSTPRIIITKGSKIMDSSIGYMDDISLFHYFKRNGLIDEKEEFVNPYPNIERINGNRYFEIFEQKESTKILIGRIGDKNTNAILKKANDLKINLKFVNPSIFINEEDRIKFQETIESINKEAVMPILIEIKDGVIVDLISSAKEENIKR